jgi:histidinol-phosphatase (PHP family)
VIVDYHMHLRDAEGQIAHEVSAIEPFLETAVARGVDEIGFTEHVYYFRQTREIWSLPYQTARCRFDLDAYCDAVLEAKRRGWPVKLALEVDYVGALQPRLAELLEPYPWDYLLGSVHWIDGLAIDAAPDAGLWTDRPVEDVWSAYFSALAKLASSGFVDVLAHPDLPKIFGRRPLEPAAHYPALDGVALEISTAGLRKPVGELYPDAALLGERPITLASDAHEPPLVGEAFDAALALARAAGYETVTVFEGRRARQEPLG